MTTTPDTPLATRPVPPAMLPLGQSTLPVRNPDASPSRRLWTCLAWTAGAGVLLYATIYWVLSSATVPAGAALTPEMQSVIWWGVMATTLVFGAYMAYFEWDMYRHDRAPVEPTLVPDRYHITWEGRPAARHHTDIVSLERRVQRDGAVKWVVVTNGEVLSRTGEWEWESMPSSRTDDFIARTRYDSIADALAHWKAAPFKTPFDEYVFFSGQSVRLVDSEGT